MRPIIMLLNASFPIRSLVLLIRQRLIDWCDVGLATGSTLVNGSLDNLLARFEAASKPLAFFGNTIAGTAALNNLQRVCPFGA